MLAPSWDGPGDRLSKSVFIRLSSVMRYRKYFQSEGLLEWPVEHYEMQCRFINFPGFLALKKPTWRRRSQLRRTHKNTSIFSETWVGMIFPESTTSASSGEFWIPQMSKRVRRKAKPQRNRSSLGTSPMIEYFQVFLINFKMRLAPWNAAEKSTTVRSCLLFSLGACTNNFKPSPNQG